MLRDTIASGPVVIAGPGAAPDVALTSLRHRHGRADAEAELSLLRRTYTGPLLVEPFSAADLPAITEHADGVVVGAGWMQDFQLLRAAARTGHPVVIQRAPAATLEEWLSAAEYCVAEGNRDVVLCETGTRTHLPRLTLDLGLVREAGRRVHRVPDHRVFERGLYAGHHLAGVQPDPQPERRATAALVVEYPTHRALHGECRPYGALRVVLVGDRCTEDRHDPVAGQLVHVTAEGLHRARQGGEYPRMRHRSIPDHTVQQGRRRTNLIHADQFHTSNPVSPTPRSREAGQAPARGARDG